MTAVAALIIALVAMFAGYLVVAPLGFLAFELAVILAVVLSTTPARSPSDQSGGSSSASDEATGTLDQRPPDQTHADSG